MNSAYPVCFRVSTQDAWVAWCPEDEEGSDRFLETNGMLIWSKKRVSLCQFVFDHFGKKCSPESSFFDFDKIIQQLEKNVIATPELFLNVWNLLTDLTSARRHGPGPFRRDLVGVVDQYDLLFFLSQDEKIVMKSAPFGELNASLLQKVFISGRNEVFTKLKNGYEVLAV